jgi:hypothetical protein
MTKEEKQNQQYLINISYQEGYAAGLKRKSEELSPLIEKLTKDFNQRIIEQALTGK